MTVNLKQQQHDDDVCVVVVVVVVDKISCVRDFSCLNKAFF